MAIDKRPRQAHITYWCTTGIASKTFDTILATFIVDDLCRCEEVATLDDSLWFGIYLYARLP